MSENLESDREGTVVAIPLTWGVAEHLSTIYANQLYISHAGDQFFLVFGEAIPVVDPDQLPKSIEIKPVAKIVITPQNMLRIAEVIQNNVARFKNRPGIEEGDR